MMTTIDELLERAAADTRSHSAGTSRVPISVVRRHAHRRTGMKIAASALTASAGVISVWSLSVRDSDPASESTLAGDSTTPTGPGSRAGSPSTGVAPTDRNYRVVDAHLSVSRGEATLDVGSEHGIQPGLGVYQAELIGIVGETRAASSTVRLLGSADVVVRAAVGYPDAIEGTARTVGNQLVFTPDESPSGDGQHIVGMVVVVAGGPGSLLHAKTPIGTITQSMSIDGSIGYLIRLSDVRSDSDATIIVPN
jgi:hypothetical protein